jgi:hypothetical protein
MDTLWVTQSHMQCGEGVPLGHEGGLSLEEDLCGAGTPPTCFS